MIGSAEATTSGSGQPTVDRYHDETKRGGIRAGDANVSRPAGIVAARENNSRETAVFRGAELLTRKNGR